MMPVRRLGLESRLIVGISTFISRMNITSESSKIRNIIFQHLGLYELLKFHAQLS